MHPILTESQLAVYSHLGQCFWKLVLANPGKIANRIISFSWIELFSTTYALCLLSSKLEDKQYKQNTSPKSNKTGIKNSGLSWVTLMTASEQLPLMFLRASKKGRKKKKAGEFIADDAADENGMFRERPSYDAYRKPHLLRVFLCLVCNFCKASKICFINNEVKFSESFSLTFQMVKS